MCSLVLYLNELSCACESLTKEGIGRHLINTITTIREVTKIRENIKLRMHCRLSNITFGRDRLSLGQILTEKNDRLAQFKRLIDKMPCDHIVNSTSGVMYNGKPATGLAWADRDNSFVFSLGHASPWSNCTIKCVRQSMKDDTEITDTPINIRNLATVSHVYYWRSRIQDYGDAPAKSSLIYEEERFFIRMHLDDHGYPHVHIYPRKSDTRDCIAKIRVDNKDILEGLPDTNLKTDIMKVITSNEKKLLKGWENIRRGKHPLKLVRPRT